MRSQAMTGRMECLMLLLLLPLATIKADEPLERILKMMGPVPLSDVRAYAGLQAVIQPCYHSVKKEEVVFVGEVSNSTAQEMVIFSDDGCRVTIDGKVVHDRYKKGQTLEELDESFYMIPGNLSPVLPGGQPHKIKVEYSNVYYISDDVGAPDIDGCTLFLYDVIVNLEGHDALRPQEEAPVGEGQEETPGVLIQPNNDGGNPDPREAKLRVKAAGVAGLTGEIDYGTNFAKLSVGGVALTKRVYPVAIHANIDTELGEVVPVGEWVLTDTLTATLTVKDASREIVGSDVVKFSVISATPVRLEPVTVDADEQGFIFNPCGVAMNGLAKYKVDVVPAGTVPDSAIHWSIASGDVKFDENRNTGRTAIIRGGNTPDSDFKLEVTVDGLPSTYKPYIYGRVLKPTTVQVRAYVICDANGVEAVSRSTINAWIAEANRIYKQVAMTFTLESVTTITTHPEWFKIDSKTSFRKMCSYANYTGGLELYCVGGMYVPGLHSDMRLAYGDAMRGMAVRADANLKVLSHEIGHACGLSDMYEYDPGDGFVSEDKTYPMNWSGGEGTGYYAPDLLYRNLTHRVIMDSDNETRVDIPLDGLSALVGTTRLPISVGLQSNMNRHPLH